MTSVTRSAAANEDMSTDNQEDSTGNKQALRESQEVAQKTEEVQLNKNNDGRLSH